MSIETQPTQSGSGGAECSGRKHGAPLEREAGVWAGCYKHLAASRPNLLPNQHTITFQPRGGRLDTQRDDTYTPSLALQSVGASIVGFP